MRYQLLFAALLFLGAGLRAQAQGLSFNNLSDDQAKKIIREMSANFTHTSVSGAAPLGSIFGFELGLVAGVTKADEVKKLVQSVDPNTKVDYLPHAGILGIVTVPFGVTLEASVLPEVGNDDFKFKNLGLGLKWTLNSVLEMPVDVALKLHSMSTNLRFRQTVSSVTSTVELKDRVTGLMALVSKNFVFVEPYAGFGILSGNGDFTVTGTTAFFSSGATSYSAKESGSNMVFGVNASLFFVKLGAEFARTLGANSMNLKFAFSF